MTEATLIILASLCALLGSISVAFDSFRHRVVSVLAVTGSFFPWIAMLLFYRITSSEPAAWTLVLSGPVLNLVAGVGFLLLRSRVASLLMWICFFVALGWLTAYLSAIGMAHV